MKRQTAKIFELQAELCKTIANPRRLEILSALKDGEKRVNDLVEIIGIPKANVSQHLAFMRRSGIVETRKEGTYIYYRLTSPKILTACAIMREVLAEQLKKNQSLLRSKRENFFCPDICGYRNMRQALLMDNRGHFA